MSNNDYFFVTLTTLSQITEGDKLGVKQYNDQNMIIIDKWHISSFCTRWYNGFNRDNSINLLNSFTDNLEKLVNLISRGNLCEDANRLSKYFDPAISGLNLLKSTYCCDSHIWSEISLVISRFEIFKTKLMEIENLEDVFTDILKSDKSDAWNPQTSD